MPTCMRSWGSSVLLRARGTFRGRPPEYLVREPDAGEPPVRFDEQDVETELWWVN
jgi:hypothetical protein